MKKLAKCVFPLIMAVGCQTTQLRHDPNNSSIESDYQSIETICNDHLNVGNNGCYTADDKTESITLKVRTVQDGVLTVVSEICKINWNYDYDDSEWVTVPLVDLIGEDLKQSCLLSIMLNPEYDDQEESIVKVYGFYGEVLIKPTHGEKTARMFGLAEDWDGIIPIQSRREPHERMEMSPDVALDFGDSEMGFYSLIGCGKSIMGGYPTSGVLLDKLDYTKSCIYHGVIVPLDQNNDMVFSVMLNIFDTDYEILQEPVIIPIGKRLVLDFDPEVTFVELNDRTYNQYQIGIIRYRPEERYEVRAYTVKGRYLLGVHEDGFWRWYN